MRIQVSTYAQVLTRRINSFSLNNFASNERKIHAVVTKAYKLDRHVYTCMQAWASSPEAKITITFAFHGLSHWLALVHFQIPIHHLNLHYDDQNSPSSTNDKWRYKVNANRKGWQWSPKLIQRSRWLSDGHVCTRRKLQGTPWLIKLQYRNKASCMLREIYN